MKNRLMFEMMSLLLLLLAMPNWLWAEAGDIPKGSEIQANVPHTPEKFLQVIKLLLASPDEDGRDFCEKGFGFDRTKWVSDGNSGSFCRLNHTSKSSMLPYPLFQFGPLQLDCKYKLNNFELDFYRNPSFRMTPAMTQKNLGPPTRIVVSSPRSEEDLYRYSVMYIYETSKYYLRIKFINRDEDEYPAKGHTLEQIQNEQAHRRFFEIHKDYLALVMNYARK